MIQSGSGSGKLNYRSLKSSRMCQRCIGVEEATVYHWTSRYSTKSGVKLLTRAVIGYNLYRCIYLFDWMFCGLVSLFYTTITVLIDFFFVSFFVSSFPSCICWFVSMFCIWISLQWAFRSEAGFRVSVVDGVQSHLISLLIAMMLTNSSLYYWV